VANSSSAACGVVPCHAYKGTADNSVARSQWLFIEHLIEHLRENQTPEQQSWFPLVSERRWVAILHEVRRVVSFKLAHPVVDRQVPWLLAEKAL
jgi:hypothetical protein